MYFLSFPPFGGHPIPRDSAQGVSEWQRLDLTESAVRGWPRKAGDDGVGGSRGERTDRGSGSDALVVEFEKEGDRLIVYRETESWVEVGESFRMSGFAFRGWVARESVILSEFFETYGGSRIQGTFCGKRPRSGEVVVAGSIQIERSV